MGIKKFFRAKSQEAHSHLHTLADGLCTKLLNKLRWNGRMRLANRWASRNPRKWAVYTYCAFFLIFLSCFIPVQEDVDRKTLGLEDVTDIRPVVNGLHHIQTLNDARNRSIVELSVTGAQLKNEYDSLMSIGDKSHDDSIRIYHVAKKLELLSQL